MKKRADEEVCVARVGVNPPSSSHRRDGLQSSELIEDDSEALPHSFSGGRFNLALSGFSPGSNLKPLLVQRLQGGQVQPKLFEATRVKGLDGRKGRPGGRDVDGGKKHTSEEREGSGGRQRKGGKDV